MSKIRIVVTGAAGFIGSRLIESLVRVHPAEALLAVDHPVPESKRTNLSLAVGVTFMPHDTFVGALETGAIRPELIYHLGACSSTTETDWAYLRDNNLIYSQRLWQSCAMMGCRFLYASSAATYGDGSLGFDDERDISLLEPLNLYGKSKHDFDLWVRNEVAAGRPRPPQWAGFKFFNVFGPGEGHKGRMASMAFHGWNQIRRGGSVRLFQSHNPAYPDGGQLRDFIYVGDVVAVMLSVADRPAVCGLFNLGTGRANSFRQLVECLFAAVGLPPQIEYVPMPEDLRGKYQYFTEATMTKLAHAGVVFSPRPLDQAVADYVKWLRAP